MLSHKITFIKDSMKSTENVIYFWYSVSILIKGSTNCSIFVPRSSLLRIIINITFSYKVKVRLRKFIQKQKAKNLLQKETIQDICAVRILTDSSQCITIISMGAFKSFASCKWIQIFINSTDRTYNRNQMLS